MKNTHLWTGVAAGVIGRQWGWACVDKGPGLGKL